MAGILTRRPRTRMLKLRLLMAATPMLLKRMMLTEVTQGLMLTHIPTRARSMAFSMVILWARATLAVTAATMTTLLIRTPMQRTEALTALTTKRIARIRTRTRPTAVMVAMEAPHTQTQTPRIRTKMHSLPQAQRCHIRLTPTPLSAMNVAITYGTATQGASGTKQSSSMLTMNPQSTARVCRTPCGWPVRRANARLLASGSDGAEAEHRRGENPRRYAKMVARRTRGRARILLAAAPQLGPSGGRRTGRSQR
mmetsp:Transcript_48689/g.103894  ORF Transcript_48689/g.103894 Transcript_48689/m.103894 type:complete len:253 (-) Transcript_48689:1216-1974(-)